TKMSVAGNRHALRRAFLELFHARLGPKVGALCQSAQRGAGGHQDGKHCNLQSARNGAMVGERKIHSAVESTKDGRIGAGNRARNAMQTLMESDARKCL